MRHFGHGVGHLQYERQHELEPDHNDTSRSMGQTHEDSDVSDSADDLDSGESDPDELEIGQNCNDNIAVDSDEEEEDVNDEEEDASDIIFSDSESDGDVDGSAGYASY